MRVKPSVRRTLIQPDTFDPPTLKDLEGCILCTLSEHASRERSASRLWNSILNGAVESSKETDRDR